MKKTNVTLWIVQGLLAALFLFAGTMKFLMPIEEMVKQSHLPAAFLWFIGAAEVLGGLGLLLPGLTRIAPFLTPLAASGLAIIMAGATVLSLPTGPGALFPLVVGILAVLVAWGRWRVVPHHGRGGPSRSSMHPAAA